MDWIIAHGDTDGICSAAIALAARKGSEVFFSHPSGLAEDLKQVEGNVVICDIALSSTFLQEVMAELKRIAAGGGSILYIDHHPLPRGFRKEDFPGKMAISTMSCTSELTYLEFKDLIPSDMSRVAIYGAIGDYMDNTYEIRRLLLDWEKRSMYLESGLLIQAIDAGGRDYETKRKMVSFLATNRTPSSDQEIVEKAIAEAISEEEMRKRVREEVKVFGSLAYVLDLKWSMGKSAVYARAYGKRPVGIGAETRKGRVDMSIRTSSEQIDLNELLQEIAPKHNGSGGGHPMAAGARVPEGKFFEFLEDFNALVEKNERKRTVEY
ncbi:MAG: DHHA1 domain-containing protein [Candidatus Methanosuratincola verstraetei]|jgi:single-stranded-DNA-specific exonuclease